MPRPSGFRSRKDGSGGRKVYPIFSRSDNPSPEPAPKPEEYKELPRSSFADPFNAKYPVTQGHIHAALTYWARPEDRRFYTKEAQDKITKKIVEQALKDGIEVTYNQDYMGSLPESVKAKLKGYTPRDPPGDSAPRGKQYEAWERFKKTQDFADAPKDGYQGYRNWDTWETALIIDNDERLNRNKEAWGKNFLLKMKRGTFDKDAAAMAIHKYLFPEARKQDEGIDPRKVDFHELVDTIVSDAKENQEYEAKAARREAAAEIPVGTYGPRYAHDTFHSTGFDLDKPATKDVYWRATVKPNGQLGLGKPEVLYGMTFAGQQVRHDFKDAGLGSVEHLMLMQGLGAGEVQDVEFFRDGHEWYEDHYGPGSDRTPA